MKLNEKNVACFAVSKSPIDKEGWLLKRGEVNKSFQRRWFVLKGNLFFYFDKKTEKEPSGVIILEGCTIELAEFEEQYAFKIVFHGAGDRTYVMGADTQETMESWMKALACASYDYMKLMVSEMQRQLDEMIELEKAHSVSIFGGEGEGGGQVALRNGSLPNPKAHSAESLQRVPTAPPRFKGNRHKRDPVLVPGQRINPFNRCQSEEDFEKTCSAAVLPSSAPGTPRCLHHGAPPQRANFDRCVEKLQGRRAPTPMLHLFNELHKTYGARIRNDIEDWQRAQRAKSGPPVGKLICFD